MTSAPPIRFELESKLGTIYGPEDEQAVIDVVRRGAPTSGESCLAFEREFARYCGTTHARAVSNGSAALFLSLKAMDIGPGDRVITTAMTWIATAAAAITLGADVDFADIDPLTYNVDPNELEKKLAPNTKAVIPVHLYGQCCDMDAILGLAREHGFAVVEDACHAVGAVQNGHKAGGMGATGCFSFHEQKNMSTLGEGGMIVTNDAALFEQISLYRSHCARVHGPSTKYCQLDPERLPVGDRPWWQDFDDAGYNFRMTDAQAAVGLVQLRKLDAMNRRRIEIARQLTDGLRDVPGIITPTVAPGNSHVFHLYPVEIDSGAYGLTKDEFIRRMRMEYGIKIGTHYIPVHWSTAFQRRGFRRGEFPVAESVFERLVTLPIHPRLTEEAVAYLVDCTHSLARKVG